MNHSLEASFTDSPYNSDFLFLCLLYSCCNKRNIQDSDYQILFDKHKICICLELLKTMLNLNLERFRFKVTFNHSVSSSMDSHYLVLQQHFISPACLKPLIRKLCLA